MKKVIIIDHEPLTIRRVEIFRINELRERGVNVEHWDMSQYFHKGMSISDRVKTEYSRKILDLKELTDALDHSDIVNTIFIVEAFENYKYRTFFRILSERKCFCVKLELYATTLSGNLSLWQKLKIGNGKSIAKALNNRFIRILNRVYYKIHNIDIYAIYVSSGNNPSIDIHINHPDWEKALEVTKEPKRLVNKRYAVFCDEYFPLHPDLFYFEKEKIKNLNEVVRRYRTSLCAFFNKIEKEYNLEIVIAAHPKSDYPLGSFGNRLIIKYKTPQLVKDCEFVLLHASTSVSYAIIFDKPFGILTTLDYKKVKSIYYYQSIMSKQLNLNICNIDYDMNFSLNQLPQYMREKYIYDFLTSPGIEKENNTDILYKEFSTI